THDECPFAAAASLSAPTLAVALVLPSLAWRGDLALPLHEAAPAAALYQPQTPRAPPPEGCTTAQFPRACAGGSAISRNHSVPRHILASASALALLLPFSALAQTLVADNTLEAVVVTGERHETDLPNKIETLDAHAAQVTINAVNTEDMMKYMPSILVRKRHY